jgi:hypothetical protein
VIKTEPTLKTLKKASQKKPLRIEASYLSNPPKGRALVRFSRKPLKATCLKKGLSQLKVAFQRVPKPSKPMSFLRQGPHELRHISLADH